MTREEILSLRAMAVAVVAQQEAHLVAVRAQGAALVAQCDAALARMEPVVVTATSGVQPSAAPPCEHAEVINTSVPGFPHRAKCRACGQTVYKIVSQA